MKVSSASGTILACRRELTSRSCCSTGGSSTSGCTASGGPGCSSSLLPDATTTTTASGGSEEASTDVVKATAPRLYAANDRAVRRDDYVGHILSLTGAVAARAFGEYEEATQKAAESGCDVVVIKEEKKVTLVSEPRCVKLISVPQVDLDAAVEKAQEAVRPGSLSTTRTTLLVLELPHGDLLQKKTVP